MKKTIKQCAVKMQSTPRSPLYQPHGPRVRPRRMQSITWAEIDYFWRRKLEEEERQLADEKEAARIKTKTLKQEEYMLFEKRIDGIINEKNETDKIMEEGEITKNSKQDAFATRNSEIRIGIKDWWRKSSCAYLNEPAVTSMDDNGSWKGAATCIPQKTFWVLLTSSLPDKHGCFWDLLSEP